MRYKIFFKVTPEALERNRLTESTYAALQQGGYATAIGEAVLQTAPFVKDELNSTALEVKYACDFVVFPTSDWERLVLILRNIHDKEAREAVLELEMKHTFKIPQP